MKKKGDTTQPRFLSIPMTREEKIIVRGLALKDVSRRKLAWVQAQNILDQVSWKNKKK